MSALSDCYAQAPHAVYMASNLRAPALRVVLVAILIATLPMTAVMIGLSATLRDQATLDRLFGTRLVGRPFSADRALNLTPRVRRLRRQVMRSSCVLLLVSTVIAFLVWYLRTILHAGTVVDLVLIPVALALATLAHMLFLRRRSDQLPFQRQPILPAVIGITGALVVFCAANYTINGAVALVVLSGWFFLVPFSIARLVPFLMMAFLASFFVRWTPKILRYAAVPMDLARRLTAGSVDEALRQDMRREVLFLRSFDDDDLVIRTHRMVRHSPVELATTQPFERFEVALTWSLWRVGPVCAIGRPDSRRRLQPLGAAREYYSDATWQQAAGRRIADSALIVFVLGRTEGLQWEIAQAKQQSVLGKCLFVVPPVLLADVQERLAVLGDVLGMGPTGLPCVVGDGGQVIGVYFNDMGDPVIIYADGRDDLAYQALVDFASETLATGKGELLERVSILDREKQRPTADRLNDLMAQIAYDHEAFIPTPSGGLTALGGLKFIVRSVARRRAAQSVS